MIDFDSLVTRAFELESDRFVSLSAKAGVSLALPPLKQAKANLVAIQERMARTADSLTAVLNGSRDPLPDHDFDAPHYSKITVLAAAGHYRTAFDALHQAVYEAEQSIFKHAEAVKRIAA